MGTGRALSSSGMVNIGLSSLLHILLSMTLTSVLPSLALAIECQHRILFVPQSHPVDENLTDHILTAEEKDSVAASQLKIAKLIERFQGVAVFTEQAGDEDYSLDSVSPESYAASKSAVRQAFPFGIPQKAEDLTFLQRQIFIEKGGGIIQLLRGKLNVLRRVIANEKAYREIFDPIQKWLETKPSIDESYPPEIGQLVFGARERAALTQIKKYFAKNPDQIYAILILGANHNLSFYTDIFPDECITLPQEFREDWTGRDRSGPEGFSSTPKQQPAKGAADRSGSTR